MAANAVAADGSADNSNGVVILNTNTNSNANSTTASQSQSSDQALKADQAQKAVAQPTTVVEASPAVESRADVLRKERQGAEVETQQKIDEKLESSRLQDERARAERLFGNRLDPQPQAQQQAQPAPVVVAPAPAPAPVAPVETKATSVTIEKVEIIQPKEEKVAEEKKDDVKAEPVAETRAAAPVVNEEPKKNQYYISALAGGLNYSASNVKSNYGVGVAVGTIVNQNIGLELSYLYSDHDINTFWVNPIYRQLSQNDISAKGKYYFLTDRLRPFLGASVTYSNRQYTDRVRNGAIAYTNNDSESTNAVDMGVLGGLDFLVTQQFAIGASVEYNFNIYNSNEPDWVNAYNTRPAGTTPLEQISYYVFTVNAKLMF